MKKLCLILVLLLSCTACQKEEVPVEDVQEEEIIEKIYTFETTDSSESGNVDETIVIDGKTYQLVDLNKTISSSKEVVQIVEEAAIAQGDEIETEKEFEIGQDSYVLTLIEQNTTEEKTNIQVTKEIYFQQVNASFSLEDAPLTIPLIVWQDGQQVELNAEIVSIEQTSAASWLDDLVVNATFTGDEDTEYFQAGDTEISINSASPTWDGWQSDVLEENNLSSSYYRLTSADWTSEYSQTGSGYWQRTAQYRGSRKVADFTCEYLLDYETTATVGQFIYEIDADLVQEPTDTVTIYEVEVVASYKLVEDEQ